MAGPAMAASIAFALGTPNLVLFSMLAVGAAANKLGGAGGPLAVYVVTIFASELGNMDMHSWNSTLVNTGRI
jgi:hypothetical protein